MDKKEAAASEVGDILEKMTIEELFKLLSESDREYIRLCIERAVLMSDSESEKKEK